MKVQIPRHWVVMNLWVQTGRRGRLALIEQTTHMFGERTHDGELANEIGAA